MARAGLLALFFLLGASMIHAQEEAAAAPEEAPPPPTCPVDEAAGFDDRFAVAQVLIAQRNLAQAEACLNDAVAHTLGAVRQLSDLAALQALPNRAVAFSSVLETLSPRDGEAVYLHAQRLGQAGRWAEAQPRLTELRGANPANAAIANTLGASLYHTDKAEDAKREFEFALAQAPGNEDYKANLLAATEKLVTQAPPPDEE